MSLLLLDPRAWVCLSLFLSFEPSDAPLTLARRRDSERTPLQLKLDDLADAIAQIGCMRVDSSLSLLFVTSLNPEQLISRGMSICPRQSNAKFFREGRRVNWELPS